MSWTPPYYGITHLGELRDQRRATVAAYSTFAVLTYWLRGGGFSPAESVFDDVETAKRAGERWVETGVTE